MVLESLVDSRKATGKPWEMYFIGVIYSFVGMILGFFVFKTYVSIIMVTFTVIAAVPFVRSAIIAEEEKGRIKQHLFKEHSKIISMFTFLFLGYVTVYFIAFLLSPEKVALELFTAQLGAITEVRQAVSGNFYAQIKIFSVILANNMRVLFFCLLFSFFYGAGAIFILSWNASVMGAAIGSTIKQSLGSSASSSVQAISAGLAHYFVHGIPEIVSYFVAGLAGGIISVALMRHGLKSMQFRKASKDALHLFAFACLLLVIAALIEVNISPKLL